LFIISKLTGGLKMSQIVLLSIQENKEEEIVAVVLVMKSPEKSRIIWEIPDISGTRVPRPRYGQLTISILNKLHDMNCKLLATHPHTSPRHTPYQDYLYYHNFFLEAPDDFDPRLVK
jgi:hypothetical protein